MVLAPAAFAKGKFGGEGLVFGGYEKMFFSMPDNPSVIRLIYGARGSFGVPALALEGEYSQEYMTTDTTYSGFAGYRGRAGLRLGLPIAKVFLPHVRIGYEAKPNIDESETGLFDYVVNPTDPIEWIPYAGLGLKVNFKKQYSLITSLAFGINSISDLSKSDYDFTVGVAADY